MKSRALTTPVTIKSANYVTLSLLISRWSPWSERKLLQTFFLSILLIYVNIFINLFIKKQRNNRKILHKLTMTTQFNFTINYWGFNLH